ncbi:hypothetical protein ACFQFG_22245 [Methylobacterium persicinum]
MSFSIYLVHVPIWFAVEGALRIGAAAGATWLLPDARQDIPVMVSPLSSTVAADALVVVYLSVVLAVSAWTVRRIETPARLWSRRVADRVRSDWFLRWDQLPLAVGKKFMAIRKI